MFSDRRTSAALSVWNSICENGLRTIYDRTVTDTLRDLTNAGHGKSAVGCRWRLLVLCDASAAVAGKLGCLEDTGDIPDDAQLLDALRSQGRTRSNKKGTGRSGRFCIPRRVAACNSCFLDTTRCSSRPIWHLLARRQKPNTARRCRASRADLQFVILCCDQCAHKLHSDAGQELGGPEPCCRAHCKCASADQHELQLLLWDNISRPC